ncbi:MAG: hypothetical protein PHP74_01710, partial [Candidatus Gracilibacteria bacterium]|nr:hypothetical protein [Candidatus Gracilibacteria bacterium]
TCSTPASGPCYAYWECGEDGLDTAKCAATRYGCRSVDNDCSAHNDCCSGYCSNKKCIDSDTFCLFLNTDFEECYKKCSSHEDCAQGEACSFGIDEKISPNVCLSLARDENDCDIIFGDEFRFSPYADKAKTGGYCAIIECKTNEDCESEEICSLLTGTCTYP